MLAQGIEPRSIRTGGISVIRERVRARRGRPARTRYRASAELVILSRDIPRLGRVIDAAADTGADVFGPEFGFSDPSQGNILATRAALADARRRADDAATQLGLRVTGVQSVDLVAGHRRLRLRRLRGRGRRRRKRGGRNARAAGGAGLHRHGQGHLHGGSGDLKIPANRLTLHKVD